MRSSSMGFVLVASFLFAANALADQSDSGPKAGVDVPALKAVTATGDAVGKEVDYAADRKDKPTLFVFVQADRWDRPVARFLRALDEELAKAGDGAHMVVVWLTEDVEKAKDYLPKAQESLKLARSTFAVHPGNRNGPADWSINNDSHVTAVVALGGKVVASTGFGSVNETDAPAVAGKLKAKK